MTRPECIPASVAGRVLLLALALLGGFAAPALAQKTDVIELFNGDRVTGEIRSYASGRLTLETDIASSLNVK